MQQRLARKNGTAPMLEKKKQQPIAKVSEKQKEKLKDEKPKRNKQMAWFEKKVKCMQGRCMECGAPINKNVYAFAIMTIAHVLPKRDNQFPSVATHEDNSLELCVENGCHQTYDRSWEDAAQMKVWPLALSKIIIMYPAIATSERQHLPDSIRQEIEF